MSLRKDFEKTTFASQVLRMHGDEICFINTGKNGWVYASKNGSELMHGMVAHLNGGWLMFKELKPKGIQND